MPPTTLRYPPSQGVDRLKEMQAGITAYIAGVRAVREQGFVAPPPGAVPDMGPGGAPMLPPPGVGQATASTISPMGDLMAGTGSPAIPSLVTGSPIGGAVAGMAAGLSGVAPPALGGAGAGMHGAAPAPAALPAAGGMGGTPPPPVLPPRMAQGGRVGAMQPPAPLSEDELFLGLAILLRERGALPEMAEGGVVGMGMGDTPDVAPDAMEDAPNVRVPQHFLDFLNGTDEAENELADELRQLYARGEPPGRLWLAAKAFAEKKELRELLPAALVRGPKRGGKGKAA